MIKYFPVFFLLLLVPLSFPLASGVVENFTTNKSLYYEGETMHISGTVSSDLESPEVTVVVFDPSRSTFVTLASTTANSEGHFSTTIHVGGPTWTVYGVYPVQVTSEGSSMEKSIAYKDSSPSSEPSPEPVTPSSTDSDSSASSEPSNVSESTVTFKSVKKSESATEPKSSSSSSQSGTHFTTLKLKIPNFPSLDKSPQYYIDRYNDEPNYKSWFDSQFPSMSIYNVLGYENPVAVPDWIRANAEWWADEQIDDEAFVTGIEFMIENNIIMISNIPSTENTSTEDIPSWIRNSADWWSQDLISEDEFINSLKFLIQEGIITIN